MTYTATIKHKKWVHFLVPDYVGVSVTHHFACCSEAKTNSHLVRSKSNVLQTVEQLQAD